jgi:thioredoxin-related protein
MSTKRSHPHFDDRGSLDWHTCLADALAQAKREKKHLFIELGREACGQCRSLVQSVVPRPDVAPLLQQHFVALAADADDTESEVEDLAMNLEDATMLPFVLFVDVDGKFVDGLSGQVNPVMFAATLKRISGAS